MWAWRVWPADTRHGTWAGTGRTDGYQEGKFLDWGLTDEGVGLLRGGVCNILAQGSIGLIGYSYHKLQLLFRKLILKELRG